MLTDGIHQDYLNGQSAAILVVFVVVSFFVIWPVKIPVLGFLQRALVRTLRVTRIIDSDVADRLSRRRLHFHLSLETAPVIGVLLLLATTTIDGSTFRLGVKGDENIKPYDVLVLFISLAYIAIALDGTGALEAVAFWVSQKGGSSGPRLFAYLYAFFLFTGCIVGNDPLILSGTPFLAYLTKYTNLDPTPWIFSEFMAANTASAVLVSSNPTNILITGSFSLNFLTGFTKWTVLPSVIPGIINYFVLCLMFRNRIPKTLVPLKDDPWTKLRDPRGALFLSVLMLVTIAVLVGTSFVPNEAVQVWMVTAPAGLSALAFEIVSDLVNPVRQEAIVKDEQTDPAAEMTTVTRVASWRSQTQQPHLASLVETAEKEHQMMKSDPETNLPDTTYHAAPTPTTHDKPPQPTTTTPDQQPPSIPSQSKTLLTHLQTLRSTFPRTSRTRGGITVFAHGFARASTTVSSTVFFFGFLSAAFLCPLFGTNIGATLLLVEVLRDPNFSGVVEEKVLKGAVYAVAMGSNLGAFGYVFAGSLAGLLWRKLLADKDVRVGMDTFALVNLVPLVVSTAVSCGIVVGEVYWFG